jgi:hypothetical protein
MKNLIGILACVVAAIWVANHPADEKENQIFLDAVNYLFDLFG